LSLSIVVITDLICPKVIPLFSKIYLTNKLSCNPVFLPLSGLNVSGIPV